MSLQISQGKYILFAANIFVTYSVPDVKICRCAKYFGCVDNIRNILNLWVDKKERSCRLMAEKNPARSIELCRTSPSSLYRASTFANSYGGQIASASASWWKVTYWVFKNNGGRLDHSFILLKLLKSLYYTFRRIKTLPD